jgi:DNA-binding LytR/AlgR family response regulator
MPQVLKPQSVSYSTRTVIKYNDLYFRLISCYIASHIIVAYGLKISFFKLLVMPYYHYAVILSFPIALTLFAIIKTINIRLDQKFEWTEKTVQRIGTQIFFGFVIPAVCAFILAFLYFILRGRDIFRTTYLQYDYWFILLQLLLINLYYIAYYFYQKWSHAEKTISLLALKDAYPSNETKEFFQVSKGAANLLLAVDEIAYFFRDEECNYLRTVSSEDYFINTALDEVQQQLPEDVFFRANRQLIIHRQACKAYDLLAYGKLNVKLQPPLATDAVVSQKRAKDFKKWIDQ